MKTNLATLALLVASTALGHGQTVNWRALAKEQGHVIRIAVGYDHGATTQIGYEHALTIVRPALLKLDYSFPMGRDVLDDFKIRLGADVEAIQIGGFSATVRVLANFRRFENDLVRIVSFGSEMAVIAGYSAPSWYAAGEFGFDKSIISHLKHSDIMRGQFTAIRDGWFIPSGGHYFYGIQGAKTLGENLDISLRLGLTDAQDDDEDAIVPFYAQLGVGMRF